MGKPTLTYFDMPASRGEECRLAFHLAGIDFVDRRIRMSDWPALRPNTPFGAMPFVEWPGHPPLGQSNAILTLIGRQGGLHPKDDFEAARHEAMMCHMEALRDQIGSTLRMDEAEKKRVRATIVESYLPAWGANGERQCGGGPFFGGASLSVVDLKIHVVIRWLASGKLDHIPASSIADFKKLNAIREAVRNHPGVKSWDAKNAARAT